jgi:hypothetical protein
VLFKPPLRQAAETLAASLKNETTQFNDTIKTSNN